MGGKYQEVLHTVSFCLTAILIQVNSGWGQVDPGSPLFLTPLIKAGEVVQAREVALVREFLPVISYSGFITVNEEHNSNLFFWFFPSEETYGDSFYENDVPVLLWNDGGPGAPMIFNLFNAGPFNGNQSAGSYTLNPFSWHRKYHMIHLDNPVDVGYSFTDKEEGFVYSSEEAARDIYEFLTQFFTMFPHLQKNRFFATGTSYGGTYATDVATLIHKHNQENPMVHINLEGVVGDTSLYDFVTQTYFADSMYKAGVINAKTRDAYIAWEGEMRELAAEGKLAEAMTEWIKYAQVDIAIVTGYRAIYNVYRDFDNIQDMADFITANATRRAIHVGSRKFDPNGEIIQERMHANILQPVLGKLDDLLKAGYRFMPYVGSMDIVTGHVGVQNMARALTWEHANDFIDGERIVWKDDKGVAGYVTKVGKDSAFVIIRNAGHGVRRDQPERALEMITRFIDNNWEG